MLSKLFAWIVKVALDWALKILGQKVKEKKDQIQDDKKAEVINEENIKEYVEAKDRPDKIKAAEDLLNRRP